MTTGGCKCYGIQDMGTGGELAEGGALLIEWLEKHGVSRGEFAELGGADRAAVWRWITGERTPRIEFCAAIEEATGIPCKAWAAPHVTPKGKRKK